MAKENGLIRKCEEIVYYQSQYDDFNVLKKVREKEAVLGKRTMERSYLKKEI